MENNIEVLNKLHEKNLLTEKLNSMIYGSIEIRTQNEKKYIYVHYRDCGIARTKYVDEYTDDLYNIILKNNILSKSIKKEIKLIDKFLLNANFYNANLDESIKLAIDFARKHMVHSIYKQAILEGVNTTMADTENIIEGGVINGITSTDVQKIVNLKHAWEFVLNESVILCNKDYSVLSQINKLVLEHFFYNAGSIRKTSVNIGGTTWKPAIPELEDVKNEINDIILLNIDEIDKAIELVLYVMKRQIFIDGNKRCAIIFANSFLISKGKGLITIPASCIDEYRDLLISYYEGKSEEDIRIFLREKCISLIS